MLPSRALVITLLWWLHQEVAGYTPAAANKLRKQIIPVPAKDAKLQFNLGKFAFSLLPLSPESVGRRKTIITSVVGLSAIMQSTKKQRKIGPVSIPSLRSSMST